MLDWLKWIALILLPALAVLYGTLGETWGLPYVSQIVVTINAVALFIGTLLGVGTIVRKIRAAKLG
jgi:hypothetical protein